MSFLADSFFFKASSKPTIRSIGLCVNLKHGFDFNYRLEALDKLDCPDSACAELSDGYQKDPFFPHHSSGFFAHSI